MTFWIGSPDAIVADLDAQGAVGDAPRRLRVLDDAADEVARLLAEECRLRRVIAFGDRR